MPERHEHAGGLPQPLGHRRFEPEDGRIVAEHVVAHLGLGHGRRMPALGRVTVSERKSSRIWVIGASRNRWLMGLEVDWTLPHD